MLNATPSFEAEFATISPETVVRDWLHRLEHALTLSDTGEVMELFSASPMWRDLYALTWDITPFRGREDVEQFISEQVKVRTLTDLKVYPELPVAADDD